MQCYTKDRTMENKNTFETYEYLSINASDNDSNQFLVVQDDGNFLNVNRQIQYITQVEDVKEVLEGVQPCTVYDVAPQQFYVDVDNTSELISVPDQFILPDNAGNMYTNSYLLQSVSDDPNEVQQMEEDDGAEQINQDSSNVDIKPDTEAANKETNSCAEITLNDEQYQILEQKGWILLETNDKVFILDSLGLHDITSNDKLIQKLKAENQSNTGTPSSLIKKEYGSPIQVKNDETNEETVEIVENAVEQNNIIENKDTTIQKLVLTQNKIAQVLSRPLIIQDNSIGRQVSPYNLKRKTIGSLFQIDSMTHSAEKKSLKIKTKLSFTDVTSDIILGKTLNGRHLIAKVVKRPNIPRNDLHNMLQDKNVKNLQDKSSPQKQLQSSMDDTQFENLIQETLRGNTEKYSIEDKASAENVIVQLLRAPAYRSFFMDNRLVITKVTVVPDENGEVNEGKPIIITGRVTSSAPDKLHFMYLPNMLKRLMEKSESKTSNNKNEENDVDEIFMHIHILEIKGPENSTRISVTFCKRNISLKLPPIKKTNVSRTMFACSSCAGLFTTENELKEHQETQCMDVDNTLTIDTDKNENPYSVIYSGSTKIYSCNQCFSKFNKLHNCQKHMKTHVNPTSDGEGEKRGDGQTATVYKCNMCPSTYFHQGTLTKHIVTKHINVKQN